ncbi:polysaccharide biosynthesis/export family protein [Vibrio porteresiae]|uniref:Polysaccharide biosynthesis/export family protein n=1 Tax=Vibrio porteresiae DSM 19223 TaxID=1123496 RepID=A0ABZ0QCU3_9VIBR|nr:polysaccharide biosynthesis/export family protein [Vibrio porteresiae]WPC74276.1 polysaccharide biosynthesis/export family protein [Vibrio porteresiae DSM 19223]
MIFKQKTALGFFSGVLLLNSAFAADSSSFLLLNQSSSATPSQVDATTKAPNQTLKSGSYNSSARQGLLLPSEANIRDLLPSSGESLPPPYGANLFAGGYETERTDGTRDNYPIAAGDKLNIWIWGATNYSSVVTVDNQGNIFIPDIGPIHVKDVMAGSVNTYVTNKIKQVYTRNVNVYVNLLTATPVSVYLSGAIIRPGQYAGMASDSILYYLQRAGGVDSERGSYRDIEIIRQGEIIATADLYDFMRSGALPRISFKDGDIILVTPQKAAITVTGSARNPFRFELNQDNTSGEQLIKYARPLAKVSHVGIVGNRASGPISLYITYDDFKSFALKDGDKVIFNDDLRSKVLDIQVSGSYQGPSYFAVDQSTHLHDILNYIPVDPKLADTDSIYVLRKSVAERQKKMLDDSLERLERSVLTTPASSDGEAGIRAEEAKMVMQFTAEARKVKPDGRVVVSDKGNIADIQLEEGDQIVIPYKTDLIQIGGEVLMPQAVVYNSQATLDDYIAWAGGFSDRADDRNIAIVHANGLVEFDLESKIRKGDQILVLPKVETKGMQLTKDITQIIYQIAVAAKVAL